MALPAMAAVRAALCRRSRGDRGDSVDRAALRRGDERAPDSVVTLPDRDAEIAALRDGGFDAILLLPNSFRSALTARRAGIAERWGYRAGLRRLLLTRAVARPRGRRHQSDYYRELVNGLGIPPDRSEPSASASGHDGARADAFLREPRHRGPAASGLSAVTVGFRAGRGLRPRETLAAAAGGRDDRSVVARGRRACVMFGASGDRAAGREIESSLPADVGIVNAIGRTDLRLLVGAIARCAAFVSNDSGAMHLAAALGVPLVAIFGPTRRTRDGAARRARPRRRDRDARRADACRLLPPLHAARLPDRSPVHEGHHRRRVSSRPSSRGCRWPRRAPLAVVKRS